MSQDVEIVSKSVKDGDTYKVVIDSSDYAKVYEMSVRGWPMSNILIKYTYEGSTDNIFRGHITAGQTSLSVNVNICLSYDEKITVESDSYFDVSFSAKAYDKVDSPVPNMWNFDFDLDEDEDDLDARIADAVKDKPKEIKCECGASHVRHARHSDWCPIYEDLDS